MAVYKVWHSGGNPRDTHAAADGEKVLFEDMFSMGCLAPGNCTSGREGANCNCSISIEFDRDGSRQFRDRTSTYENREAWLRGMSQEDRDFFILWDSTDLNKINQGLRNRNWFKPTGKYDLARETRTGLEWKTYINKKIDDVGEVLQEDTVVYRGVRSELVEKLNVGEEFIDDGFTFMSLNEGVAADFAYTAEAGTAIIEVVLPQGTRFMYGNYVHDMAELLTKAGSRFRVISKIEASVDISTGAGGGLAGIPSPVPGRIVLQMIDDDVAKVAGRTADDIFELPADVYREAAGYTDDAVTAWETKWARWADDLPQDQRDIIYEYTNWPGLNKPLRSIGGRGEDIMTMPNPTQMILNMRPKIQAFDDAFRAAPGLEQETRVFRLFNTGEYKLNTGLDDPFQVGARFADDGYVSTTMARSWIEASENAGWGGSFDTVQLEILLPKGTKGIYANTISDFTDQFEYILARGSQFDVVERVGDRVVLRLVDDELDRAIDDVVEELRPIVGELDEDVVTELLDDLDISQLNAYRRGVDVQNSANQLNGALRSGTATDAQKIARDKLNDIISRQAALTKDQTYFRVLTGMKPSTHPEFFQSGRIFTDEAFVSVTDKLDVAKDIKKMLDGTIVRVDIPAGEKVFSFLKNGLTDDAFETLISSGRKFELIKPSKAGQWRLRLLPETDDVKIIDEVSDVITLGDDVIKQIDDDIVERLGDDVDALKAEFEGYARQATRTKEEFDRMDELRPLIQEAELRRWESLNGKLSDFGDQRFGASNLRTVGDDVVRKVGEVDPKTRDLWVVQDQRTLRYQQMLRDGDTPPGGFRGRVDKYISQFETTDDIVTYRSAILDADMVRDLQQDTLFTDRAFMATGKEGLADVYMRSRLDDLFRSGNFSSQNVLFEIRVPKGYNLGDMDLGEFVLPRDTTLKILSRTYEDGVFKIVTEVVP